MNYISALIKEHSRSNTDKIVKAIGTNSTEFKKIIEIIYNEKAPLPQRASWLLAAISEKHPELITPYISKFINSVKGFTVDAMKRNMLSALSQQEIPKSLQGKLIEICFDFILSPTEKVAVKVHSLQIIANLCKEHPELKNELKAVIENQLTKNTVAFAARARLIMKKL